MTVTKRTRFEVMRRDDYTCRYCRSADIPLTIDHVLPVSLGGSDKPDNLVTACRDCNAGKAATGPGEVLVEQVSEDAVRWANAMGEAARREREAREGQQLFLTQFHDYWVDSGKSNGYHFPLADDWEFAIVRQMDLGLSMGDLMHCVDALSRKGSYLHAGSEFRYFMGICKTLLLDRMDAAKKILEGSAADGN